MLIVRRTNDQRAFGKTPKCAMTLCRVRVLVAFVPRACTCGLVPRACAVLPHKIETAIYAVVAEPPRGRGRVGEIKCSEIG